MDSRTQIPTLEESTILERVARIVSSGHEWRGTRPDYTRLAAELEPAIPFDVFGVVLLRHDREAVRVIVCTREKGDWGAQYHQHPLEGSKMEQVLQDPVMVVQNYPDGLDGPPAQIGDALSAYPQLRATLIAPLIVGEHVLGTLELGSVVLNTYTDEMLQRLINAVVRVLAAAIESAQTSGNVEIQDRQRQALKQVSSALTSTMDLSTILHRIVVGIAEALHVASAIVMRCEQGLCLEAQTGLDAAVLRKIVESSVATSERSIIGYTLQRRQPFVSHDIAADERFPASRNFATKLAVRSIFSYPLVTGTTVYGALLLCSPEPGGFTPLKADILSLFASQATIAIHNGMLLEATWQRSRFQEAIEQLEQAHQQKVDERELLERVREESERTFGVSFSSLLRFISDHLLTRNERDLQALMQAAQEEHVSNMDQLPADVPHEEDAPGFLREAGKVPYQAPLGKRERSVAWLTQTAEAALARADILSELGRLLQLYERSAGNRTDAWFVVDLNGQCMYMNPAAEVFCGMRLVHADAAASNITLEEVFAAVLPRIRNIDEVSLYLQDFAATEGFPSQSEASTTVRQNLTNDTIRCVLAVEPGEQVQPGHLATSSVSQGGEGEASHNAQKRPRASRSKELNTSFTDRYYQLMRYSLYNQNGQLLANALRIHDITEQVRDEKNKSALLSSVSHDLRTPLTIMKAAITGLLQPGVEWDEPIRREILEEVDGQTDHLTVLIGALVEMSRIEMGALVLEKEWCDVVEIVHSALARLERVLAGRPVRIITPIRPKSHLPLIQVDYAQMERVFYNLIENAAHRSVLVEERAGVANKFEILVSLDVVDAESEAESVAGKKLLRTQVIDFGPEVPEAEREHVFKTFYSQEGGSGGGLGLAICRGIVEAHQGQIWVESAPGGKSSFVFTLPVHLFTPARSSLEGSR